MLTHPPNRWPDLMMAAYCAGMAVVGIVGLGWSPSPTLTADIGTPWVQVYSALIVVSSTIGLLGIIIGRRHVTVWAIIGLSFATLIHGLSIIFAPTGSWQTGLRLIIAPLMMVPAVLGWRFWMAWRGLQRKDDDE